MMHDMKRFLTVTLPAVFAALVLGAILGARYTILNAHIYDDGSAILLEIAGQIHEYSKD